jgi:glycosidase
MDRPLVFEINTRCWLRALSDSCARPVTLDSVPDWQFAAWQKAGFTHLWLMGVWRTGPKALALARAQPDLRNLCREALGAVHDEDIAASPYAIADYAVAECFGGNGALRTFRQRLRRRGIGLLLDFVPNHLGVDHPWVAARPELFVHCSEPRPETFPLGARWIACGKDPNSPAWTETAQLDYRVPAARAAMRGLLQSAANQCDGLRCDMAMLVLEDVFASTWRHFPGGAPSGGGEFWAEAISSVKREHPAFLFIAEAYWNLERRLHELGFDYAYDKGFYDCLARRRPDALRGHLHGVGTGFCPVRFLENHDEPPIASILDFPEQQAAAVFLLSQPGMRLLHDGQLTGRKRRTPVQLARYWPEPPDPATSAFYSALLSALPQTAIGGSAMALLETDAPGAFVTQWKGGEARGGLSAVNLTGEPIRLGVASLEPGPWRMRTILAGAGSTWNRSAGPLRIHLPPHGFLMLELAR